MNDRSNPLRFGFCTACSALILLSGTEPHVCRPTAPTPAAACAIEVPMPLHIHQGGDPRPSQIRVEPLVLTTSTSSR